MSRKLDSWVLSLAENKKRRISADADVDWEMEELTFGDETISTSSIQVTPKPAAAQTASVAATPKAAGTLT